MAGSAGRAPAGFAEFVASRSGALLRSAWLLTGDAARAEDLLQTVLIKVWRRWPTIASPEAYVRQAMFTTYVSWRRRRWRAELPTTTLPERVDQDDLATESANRDAVRRALARLSPRQRAVVVLRYVEDLSVDRTAELLNCSPAAVRVHTFRALAVLRTDPELRLPHTEEAGTWT